MKRLAGLYAITPTDPALNPPLMRQVESAIEGGARIIQYRDKSEDSEKRLREVRSLLALCRAGGVRLIVNDDLELAAVAGADGVHLGRNDADPSHARERLGKTAIIGVSCYDQIERARWAYKLGADYAAFGRFFPSATKPQAVVASLELLRRARLDLDLPLVAIGGITPENGRSLIAAGADMLAVVNGLFGQFDVQTAALSFTRLFPQEAAADDPIP